MDTTDSWIIIIGFAIFLIMVFLLIFFVYNYASGENDETNDEKSSSSTKKNTNGSSSSNSSNNNTNDSDIDIKDVQKLQINSFDGNYSNLTNKPKLFDGKYESLTGKPKQFDGKYESLTGKPRFFDGNYNNLTNKPDLFDGNYDSLQNKPRIFDGRYDNLTGKPDLFDGRYESLSGKPDLFDGNYQNLTNKPVLFDGNYDNLMNKPTLFDGQYESLSGKPDLSSLSVEWENVLNKPDNLGNNVESIEWDNVVNKPDMSSLSVEWNNVLNKPSDLGSSSESIDWNNITNKPDLSQQSVEWNNVLNKPDNLATETVEWDNILNKPSFTIDNQNVSTYHTHEVADINGLNGAISGYIDNTYNMAEFVTNEQLDEIQSQVNSKASATHTHTLSDIPGFMSALNTAQFTGAISSVQGDNLEASKVVVSDIYGKIKSSELNSSKLNHLNNVSSDIQTQLDGKSDYGHSHTVSDLVDYEDPRVVMNEQNGTWKYYHNYDYETSQLSFTEVDVTDYTLFNLNNKQYKEIFIGLYYKSDIDQIGFYPMHFMLLDDNSVLILSSGYEMVKTYTPTSNNNNKILDGHIRASPEKTGSDGKMIVRRMSNTKLRIEVDFTSRGFDIHKIFVLGK